MLSSVGEAAGTIFAYHTPFILQPLLIIAAGLPTFGFRIAGALTAIAIVIAVCAILHFRYRSGRLRQFTF
jgi:acyltransferase